MCISASLFHMHTHCLMQMLSNLRETKNLCRRMQEECSSESEYNVKISCRLSTILVSNLQLYLTAPVPCSNLMGEVESFTKFFLNFKPCN